MAVLAKLEIRGGARNLPTGGAKIRFSGYYKYGKSPKNGFSPSDGGL